MAVLEMLRELMLSPIGIAILRLLIVLLVFGIVVIAVLICGLYDFVREMSDSAHKYRREEVDPTSEGSVVLLKC